MITMTKKPNTSCTRNLIFHQKDVVSFDGLGSCAPQRKGPCHIENYISRSHKYVVL